ncbi:MAG TPA: 2-oxoacid:ferredoxin oxidoreductase subunit beta [Candidatus Thermoplasmatota archaeon]|nr:2-oxoacid:ferredoxin oxidoreductase subunit beta [Candidatus Thermoplasmatota archaeon]
MAAPAQKTIKDWQTTTASWWCPGCGDFGVLAALQRALANIGYENHEVTVVSGIGCSGKLSGYIKSYSYHSLHGRALPPAQAMKLANKGQKVIVVGGDGDGFGIGAGHFVHAARRNVDLTYIVMDNNIYGLTKGQVSPTSQLGFVTATTPHGNFEAPVNPLALFLASGGSFLAQGFSGDMKGLTAMYEEAIQHPGFALVNTFSPCVTFNKVQTYQFYRDALVTIDGQKVQHDPTNKQLAMQRVIDGNLYNGILYREVRPTPESQLKALQGVDSLTALDLTKGDYAPIIESYR